MNFFIKKQYILIEEYSGQKMRRPEILSPPQYTQYHNYLKSIVFIFGRYGNFTSSAIFISLELFYVLPVYIRDVKDTNDVDDGLQQVSINQ